MRKLLLLLCCVGLLCSCSEYRKLEIKNIDVDKIGNLSYVDGHVLVDVSLKALVDNPTGKKFAVKKVNAEVFAANRKKFASISSGDNIAVIPSKYSDTIPLNLSVVIVNPLSLASMKGFSLESFSNKNMTVDYSMVVRSGILSRKIKDKDVPVSKLTEIVKKINR